jgi:hypothetical protein
MSITAVAYAVTNTLVYSATTVAKGKPSVKKPAPLTYTGILKIDTNPPGNQPDVAPTTTIFFAKAIKINSKLFPFCTSAEIDGQANLPAKCKKAVVGGGTATAYAGQPGNPRSQSVQENLTVQAINGPKGGQLFLVVSSTPGAPVALANRVIPGTVIKASGAFGFAVRFDIPQNLQTQLGLSISLTDFNVKIPGQVRTFKVKKKSVKASYLTLTSCPGGHLPVKAISQFRDSAGTVTPVTSESASAC